MNETDLIKTTAFVGLGSNLGDRRSNIESAIEAMERTARVEIVRRTGLAQTAPWGLEDQPPFLNAIAMISTTMGPVSLMSRLKEIEKEVGRTHSEVRWGPREIDLDILLFGDLVLDTPELTIPHPRMLQRQFVIEQLVELDDSIVHPTTHVPLAKYMGRC